VVVGTLHTRSPSCHSLVFLALPNFHNNLVMKDLVTSAFVRENNTAFSMGIVQTHTDRPRNLAY
jgi:hypothetical protein